MVEQEIQNTFIKVLIVVLLGVLIIVGIVIFQSLGNSFEFGSDSANSTFIGFVATPETLSPVDAGITSSEVKANNNTWMEFDGVNDWVEFTNGINFSSIGNFSVIFWAKPTGSGERNVLVAGGGDGHFGIRGAGYWSSYNGSWQVTTATARSEEWQHLGYIYESSTANMTLYFDNNLNISYTQPVGLDVLMNRISSSSNVYDGSIDEFRIYNRTLSQSQINQIYNSGRQANSSLPSDGLVLWYSFDEAQGQIVHDKSGNGNDGI